MRSPWCHIIVHLTVAATLLTSLSCVCQGAIFSSGNMCFHEAESARHVCCHDDDHHDRDARDSDARVHDSVLVKLCDQMTVKQQERNCNHCKGLLTIGPAAPKNFARLFDLKLSPLVLDLTTVATSNRPTVFEQHFGDDPLPSSCASTLLRQHCALNT